MGGPFTLAQDDFGERKSIADDGVVPMLQIHDVCLELVRMVAPVAAQISRHDPDLARQLRRALTSVPLNIAEASDQRGARRNNHYATALGSSREAWSAIEVAVAWGYIPEPESALRGTFDQVIGTLMNVTR